MTKLGLVCCILLYNAVYILTEDLNPSCCTVYRIEKEHYNGGKLMSGVIINNYEQYCNSQMSNYYCFIECQCFISNQTDLHLIPHPPEQYASYKHIIFKNSSLKVIPLGIFTTYTSILKLYLNDSYVEDIHPGAFTGLSQLETLNLAHNNLTAISKGLFNSMHKLKLLDLSYNKVIAIEDRALLGLHNLERLILSHNNLTTLSATLFNGIKTICILDFSYNKLIDVSSDLFLHLSIGKEAHIYDIDLFSPRTTKSPVFNQYQDNDNTRNNQPITEVCGLKLDFSHNHLATVNFASFPNVTQNLNLSNNQITAMLDIETLENLKHLDLSNNKISALDNLNKQLIYFNISGNVLTHLNNFSVNDAANLTTLDFSHNSIRHLDVDNLKNLTKLRYLHLQNNLLNNITIGCFRNLHLLEFLNLSSNSIGELELGTFSGLFSLDTLDLSKNTLTSFAEISLHSLSSLHTLNISNNYLTTLNAVDLLEQTTKLKMVSLDQNPWDCESLIKIWADLKKKFVEIREGSEYTVKNVHGISCLHYEINETTTSTSVKNLSFKNSDELTLIKKLLTNDFLNSTFYKYLESLKNGNYHRDVDMNFKNSTMYNFFNKDISNSTLFKSLRENVLQLSNEMQEIPKSLINVSATELGSYLGILDRGFKNSTFYKFFNREFINTGFVKYINEDMANVLNSRVADISQQLETISKHVENDLRKYNLFKSDISNMENKLYSTDNSNFSIEAAKYVDTKTENHELFLKLSELQNSMIAIIVILLCITLFVVFKNLSVSNPFNRKCVPIQILAESTTQLELT